MNAAPLTLCCDFPFWSGSYKWAGGKSVSAFDATVVRIETNHGK